MRNIELVLPPEFFEAIEAAKSAGPKPTILTEKEKAGIRSQEIIDMVVQTYERYKTPEKPNQTASFRGNDGDGGIIIGENIPEDLTPANGEIIEL